jgi:hypothetical protein
MTGTEQERVDCDTIVLGAWEHHILFALHGAAVFTIHGQLTFLPHAVAASRLNTHSGEPL